MYRISPSIAVSDLRNMVSFYVDLMGFSLLSETPELASWVYRDKVFLGLRKVSEKRLCGNSVVCIESDDILALLTEYQNKGLSIEDCLTVIDDDEFVHGFVVTDPEGNRMEINGSVLWDDERLQSESPTGPYKQTNQ